MVDFIARHPNISGGISFHTCSGVLLRPLSSQPDDEMHAEDLWLYKLFGKKGTELTGYPNISVFHDFRYHPKQVITGRLRLALRAPRRVLLDRRDLGADARGGHRELPLHRLVPRPPAGGRPEAARVERRELGGEGYVTWHPFDHPQLGPVEIGGWNQLATFRNPPPKFLEREVERFPDWIVWQALTLPRLELLHARPRRLGGDTWRVRLVVQNTGWLPSYVSKRALERKIVRGVVDEISLPEGATLVGGKPRVEGPQLEGRAYKVTLQAFLPDLHVTADRGHGEWTVRAPKGRCWRWSLATTGPAAWPLPSRSDSFQAAS